MRQPRSRATRQTIQMYSRMFVQTEQMHRCTNYISGVFNIRQLLECIHFFTLLSDVSHFYRFLLILDGYFVVGLRIKTQHTQGFIDKHIEQNDMLYFLSKQY